MTWLEMYRRGALPLGTREAMAIALDRMHAGGHVGPKARAKANKLLRLLEEERESRTATDWQARDRHLRQQDGTRSGSSPFSAKGASLAPSGNATARPNATPEVVASRSPAGAASVGGGAPPTRRSSFDGRTASPQDLRTRIGQLGLDSSWYQTDHCTETARAQATSPSLGIRIKATAAAVAAEKRRLDREKSLSEGAIDARAEKDSEKVANRLREILGPHADQSIAESFRPGGEPMLKPPDLGPNPVAASLEARRRAERRAKQAAKSGKPADAKRMPEDVFQAYLRIKYPFAGGW